jgi:hypothetical protein
MLITETKEYFVFKNNNKFSKAKFSRAQAIHLSGTLINCKNMINSAYCVSCDDCELCIDCESCSSCLNLTNCSDLFNKQHLSNKTNEKKWDDSYVY